MEIETENKTSLHELLKKYFGFDKFKNKQEEAIQNIMNGNNTFVLMPTGGGKSLIYQLPALALWNSHRNITSYCSDEKSG